MEWKPLLISVAEFILTLGLSWGVIFGTYSTYVRIWAKDGFDVEKELREDNPAVALLFGTIMFCAALIVRESIYPVIGILTVFLTSSLEYGESGAKMLLFALSHLVFGFVVAVGSLWGAHWMFSKMNPHADEDRELRKGNPAIAVVMSGVLLVISLFLTDGVSALTKSMIPQPSFGEISAGEDVPAPPEFDFPDEPAVPEDPQ